MMVEKLMDLAVRYRRFITYCAIGSIGASLDFILFWYLHESLGWSSSIATIPAVSLGITTTFILNAFFNFKTTNQIKKRFVRYYAVGVAGLLLSVVILQVFTEWIGFDGRVVKIGSLPFIAIFQYGLNSRFSFAELDDLSSEHDD